MWSKKICLFHLRDTLTMNRRVQPFQYQALKNEVHISFIPLACVECDDSLPFSGASSITLCYVLFPATHLHQLLFHPLWLHLAIYFKVYLSILLSQILGILFSSILCTCSNQCNLFNLIVSIIVMFLTIA